MKEISYIHAEGRAAGENKHGPFSLLSGKSPVVALCLPGQTHNVMMSTIGKMNARGTPMIIIGEQEDPELRKLLMCMYLCPEQTQSAISSLPGLSSSSSPITLPIRSTGDIDCPGTLKRE
jgi:glucosamine 6-phosphate synthetase-like amidotransferase/phosphosugar isomerase protein